MPPIHFEFPSAMAYLAIHELWRDKHIEYVDPGSGIWSLRLDSNGQAVVVAVNDYLAAVTGTDYD